MKKEEIPYVLYFYLHAKVGEHSFEENGDGIMTIREAMYRMFQWKIPNSLKPAIIKIWENLGIVKKLDRRNIQFIKTDFDINDLRYVNDGLGIFPEEPNKK
jgi:hypothetical protein